jgi:hypothetical protein
MFSKKIQYTKFLPYIQLHIGELLWQQNPTWRDQESREASMKYSGTEAADTGGGQTKMRKTMRGETDAIDR